MAKSLFSSSFISGIGYLNKQQCLGHSIVGKQFISHRYAHARNLYSKNLYAHFGCVNAVEFSDDGEWLVSGGDDKRVLIWNIDKTLSGGYNPQSMKGEHNSNIFCLGFNSSHTKLYSAGNDEQVILHDVCTSETLDVFLHDEAVYSLSVDPFNENIFASACDDGRVYIWDIRQPASDALILSGSSHSFHAVMFNPVEGRLVATANSKEGIGLWDVRKPRECLLRYGDTLLNQGAMSIRFNSQGTHILALRRRLPPALFEISSSNAIVEFDHPEYYNSCTMKSCCFAGERDQFVLSGSDDFKLYAWKVPEITSSSEVTMVKNAHLILKGHRSIVNQVRYNSTYGILVSSGVEKVIKLWNTFSMSQNDGVDSYITQNDSLRKVYSHEEYVSLVLESGQFMTHDYSHHSIQEDPRMMAFFDSLVQRDIEGWISDSSDASSKSSTSKTCFEVQSDTSSSSSSYSSSSDEDDSPKWPSLQTEYALPNERVAPEVLICLASLKHKASNGQNAASAVANTAVEEKKGNSLDKISKLIAQKRHSQLLKINKKKMKLLEKLNAKEEPDSCTIKTTPNEALEEKSSDKPTAINGTQGKDNRKLFCKKRAKLYKQDFKFSATLSDLSSDDDTKKETELKNGHKCDNDANGQETESKPAKLDSSSTESENCNHSEDNIPGGLEVTSVPDSNCVSRVETETNNNLNSSILFPSRNVKQNRNYRKRKLDDTAEN